MNITNRSAYLINVFIVDLHHRCIDTCPQALNLTQCEEPVLTGAIHFDIGVVLYRLDHLPGTPQHAGCGAAHLQVILANLCAIEHGIERCDLVNLHGRHV